MKTYHDRDIKKIERFPGYLKRWHDQSQIYILHVYKTNDKWRTGWQFDDPRTGLQGIEFVLGMKATIDHMVSKFPDNKRDSCMLLFSDQSFPCHQIKLEWLSSHSSGECYYSKEMEKECWFGHDMAHYFKTPPKQIYLQFRPTGPEESLSLQGSIKTFNEKMAVNPNDAAAWCDMGFAWLSCDWREEAYFHCKRALELDPDSPGAYRLRSCLHLYSKSEPLRDLGQGLKDAQTALEKAMVRRELHSDYVRRWYKRSLVYAWIELGNLDAAIATQRSIVRHCHTRTAHKSAMKELEQLIAMKKKKPQA